MKKLITSYFVVIIVALLGVYLTQILNGAISKHEYYMSEDFSRYSDPSSVEYEAVQRERQNIYNRLALHSDSDISLFNIEIFILFIIFSFPIVAIWKYPTYQVLRASVFIVAFMLFLNYEASSLDWFNQSYGGSPIWEGIFYVTILPFLMAIEVCILFFYIKRKIRG